MIVGDPSQPPPPDPPRRVALPPPVPDPPTKNGMGEHMRSRTAERRARVRQLMEGGMSSFQLRLIERGVAQEFGVSERCVAKDIRRELTRLAAEDRGPGMDRLRARAARQIDRIATKLEAAGELRDAGVLWLGLLKYAAEHAGELPGAARKVQIKIGGS